MRLPLIVTAVCVLVAVLALRSAPSQAPAGEARPFALQDTRGTPVTDRDLRGQVVVLYFGYTFCPDVCPGELGYLARVLHALGEDAQQLAPRFITVDPQRDTAAVLDGYVPLFHPRLQALTGSPEAIAAAATTFGVTFQRVRAPGTDYDLFDHTSTIFVLDRHGHAAGRLSSRDSIARSVATLREILHRP